jgi:hypothetical protein
VRPSSRDPYFAGVLVQALGDPAVTLYASLKLPKEGEGMVHLYGSDDTLRAVRADTHLPVWGHGTGFGAAFVASNEITEAVGRTLAAEADDVDRLKLAPGEMLDQLLDAAQPAFEDLANEIRLSFDYVEGELPPTEAETD